MGTSKAQREGVLTICQCGCEQSFRAFPIYRPKAEGGGLRVPEYQRGHHPNCKKPNTAWNKGLKKGDHPSLERMGFQHGHSPFNDWSHVNEQLKTDPNLRARWLESKQGQVAWNTGITKEQYKNGIKSGEAHGNWKGGHRGLVDTAVWQQTRMDVLQRDNYTCQHCGDKNYRGRGARCNLEVHHIVALSENLALGLEMSNLITLCRSCHYKTHNYGGKIAQRKDR